MASEEPPYDVHETSNTVYHLEDLRDPALRAGGVKIEDDPRNPNVLYKRNYDLEEEVGTLEGALEAKEEDIILLEDKLARVKNDPQHARNKFAVEKAVWLAEKAKMQQIIETLQNEKEDLATQMQGLDIQDPYDEPLARRRRWERRIAGHCPRGQKCPYAHVKTVLPRIP